MTARAWRLAVFQETGPAGLDKAMEAEKGAHSGCVSEMEAGLYVELVMAGERKMSKIIFM